MLYMFHSNLFGWIDGWVLRKVVRNPEIKIWIVWVVGLVAVARVAVRRRRLDLSALMPLVEAGDRDDFRRGGQSCAPSRLIVKAISTVSSVLVIPGTHPRVNVAWSNAGDEQERVFVGIVCQGLPVLPRGSVGKSIGRKVGVHSIEHAAFD